ncbi:hypothetical protein [Brevundimonas sp.]|uniref:hypothetical protein n=1 Tax=Brevundimonas sp. TaxID=1871086 RepID=UPI0025F8A12E|nr:hypothetical protein [Brevundimonas sp.]
MAVNAMRHERSGPPTDDPFKSASKLYTEEEVALIVRDRLAAWLEANAAVMRARAPEVNAQPDRGAPQKVTTPQMAAGKAQVTPETIINWCQRYELGIKTGGRWRVYEEKLDAFLKLTRQG